MRSLWLYVLLLITLLPAASAGTASTPEIRDDGGDSIIFTGAIVPHQEILKAWIEPRGDEMHFSMEFAAMPPVLEVPKDAVYVFHYSWGEGRFYWRANWSADGSAFQYIGGIYQGCKPIFDANGNLIPPSCHSHDDEGNRQYIYFPSQNYTWVRENVRGEIREGGPGRLTWKVPLSLWGDDRQGLDFKGLFVTTYVRTEFDQLRYIDTALTEQDYIHQVYTPWWSKFVPGPSPLLVVALAALGAVVLRRRG